MRNLVDLDDTLVGSVLARGLGYVRILLDADLDPPKSLSVLGGPHAQTWVLNHVEISLDRCAIGFAAYDHLPAHQTKAASWKPSVPESDVGPLEVWDWANVGRTPSQTICRFDYESLRFWGWVFWDLERLKHWRILDLNFQSVSDKSVAANPELLEPGWCETKYDFWQAYEEKFATPSEPGSPI